ncbi:hypothetical protein E8E13_009568 [Curvularia kusanoi]|uniref:YDG domain-containing protein n=1 Tax=Curvularia kusanoi TaxID=90978 RepID=A0A9P4TF51_CURKU|nr:hypothetical protein E8E13_009568 [Curvularia kusanoi]
MPESHEVLSMQPAGQSNPFPARSVMPAWYNSVTQRDLNMLDRRLPPEARELDTLKKLIKQCEEMHGPELAAQFDKLRRQIYKAEFLHMTKAIIKKTRILTEPGLPRIFRECSKFPWDRKSDSWHLYERWMNEFFDNNILRGIVTKKGVNRNGDSLDGTYRISHPRNAKQYGDNGATLGQWWPTQLCAVRDGIHGAPQGGIHGDKEQGAFSIVLSSGGYREDEDLGDIIRYSGTAGSGTDSTRVTEAMKKSFIIKNPVRVLRSSQLPKSNKYRPICGLRYDGLYRVTSCVKTNEETQMYLFQLERIAGQQPIRFEGESKRPTVHEKRAYDDCKGKGKFD